MVTITLYAGLVLMLFTHQREMLFVRGLVTQSGQNVASFTGTMRKVPRSPRPADAA